MTTHEKRQRSSWGSDSGKPADVSRGVQYGEDRFVTGIVEKLMSSSFLDYSHVMRKILPCFLWYRETLRRPVGLVGGGHDSQITLIKPAFCFLWVGFFRFYARVRIACRRLLRKYRFVLFGNSPTVCT